jgi:glutamate N-acetyltransferase/amino-acid N-acetyltransferase
LDITDVGIVSIGNASQYILPALLENKAKELADGLGRFTFKSCLERKGLTAYGQAFKELSFTFDLGDYPCKIGALFSVSNKRAEYVEPMLCFMTTDVCISPAMLQKALETETRDTLEMLAKDGVTTPSDMTCIMSSCKAGNYKINQADSEYKKFCNALHEVLVCISKEVVCEGRNSRKAFACCVTGAQSKPLSRKIAKAIAENASVKYHFGKGQVVPQDIVTIVSQYIDLLQTEELTISLSSATGSSVLYEDGASLSVLPEMQSYICAGGDLELIVRIGRGNYTATAYGCDLVECSKNNFEKNAEGALNV